MYCFSHAVAKPPFERRRELNPLLFYSPVQGHERIRGGRGLIGSCSCGMHEPLRTYLWIGSSTPQPRHCAARGDINVLIMVQHMSESGVCIVHHSHRNAISV